MSVATRVDPVNILLVDDQPSKLLTYESILGELGENLIKVSSATEALEFLLRNDVAVVLVDVVHAGARWLRAGGDDPAASAFSADVDHLRLGAPPDRPRSAARLRVRRGGLRAGAGRSGDPARQGQRLRRAVSQDARARAAQRRARAARRRTHRGARSHDRGAAGSRSPEGRVPRDSGPRAAQPAGADPHGGAVAATTGARRGAEHARARSHRASGAASGVSHRRSARRVAHHAGHDYAAARARADRRHRRASGGDRAAARSTPAGTS